ncbi:hypothetical protein GGTG_07658 [Gaeumannomyces tritici R3-111a-1]|uniref:Uncharacterized protein n=1 Tax=Gaeumannomyces tritici (strain R3-111a-1) TaxID=644352 RepID=J3P2B0_GAET3|nr:hypothetical protein GGTG_07658 [Gaeumannomyces tritici R3-111a-1]EJT73802.1 hypothetical protein GGTG_07658 [Gaeumannomyces tritici R3-111a-1]
MAPVADPQLATRTAPDGATRVLLLPRQQQGTVTIIPLGGDVVTTTSGSTLSGGAIAGIVIGSVVGFLLLCWIFRCALIKQTSQTYEEEKGRRPRSQSYYAQEIHGVGVAADGYTHRSRSRQHSRHSHHGGHHHHHHSHSRGRGSRSRSAVRVTSTTTAQMPHVVEPTRVYYGEKRHHSRRRSSSHHDY